MHGRAISLFRVFLTFALSATSVFFSSRSALADSFNWQSVNGVNWNSPVKSQWGGTCWDYGTCSELEAKYMLTRNDPNFTPTVSDQQMPWDPPWNHFPILEDMTGFDQILKYTTAYGLVSETECPLDTNNADSPGTGDPWPLATGWENRVWKTANYQWVSLANLKNAIKTSGPIEMGFNADCMYGSVADLKANYQPLLNNGDDHTVSLVGFCDDASCPNGGYWIVKNSWGTGFGQSGYGYVPYGSSLDINQHTYALGPVYYTGPMYHTGAWDGTGVDHTGTAATNTWKGTTSAVWDTTSGTSGNWSNNLTGGTFTWVNQELQAVFDSTGSHKAITVSGTVIAHGLTINSGGTGYSFSGGSLTVTAGGIQAGESVSFSSNVYIGGPQAWNVASGKTLTVTGPLHTIISDLTFSGAGTTTISGAIDGGGVINSQGAKPGGLIQAGTGPVYLTGATNFSGNITAQSGAAPLYIAPPGAGSAIWRRLASAAAPSISTVPLSRSAAGPRTSPAILSSRRHVRSPSPPSPGRSARSLARSTLRFRHAKRPRNDHSQRSEYLHGEYDHQQRCIAGEHRHEHPLRQFPQPRRRRAAKQRLQSRHLHLRLGTSAAPSSGPPTAAAFPPAPRQ